MFPLKKKVFRLAAICLIASFMFDVFGNPVLAKKLAIEKEELDRIQTFLSFSRDFANIVLDNAKIKNVLNLAVTSQKEAGDISYGLLVLTALNEADLIDLVVSQRYKIEAANYFNEVVDAHTNLAVFWRGIGIDLQRVIFNTITTPLLRLTLNTFFIIDKTISIFVTFNVIRLVKLYDGLWVYFDERRANETHETAWDDAKEIIGWAASPQLVKIGAISGLTDANKENNLSRQIELQFQELWEKWGAYTDDSGLKKEAKEQLGDEVGFLITNLAEQQKPVEQTTPPSFSEGVKSFFSDLKGGINVSKEKINELGQKAIQQFKEVRDKLLAAFDFLAAEKSSSPAALSPAIPEFSPLPKIEEIIEEELKKRILAEETEEKTSETAAAEKPLEETSSVRQAQDDAEFVEASSPLLPALTLEEIQEKLDDLAEEIETLSGEVEKFAGAAGEEKEEEEKETEEKEEQEESKETEAKICEKKSGETVLRKTVIFNEIAWMGSTKSSNDEWLELKNISDKEVNLSGWQILDKATKIKIIFGQETLKPASFYLLERTNDETVSAITADKIYTGGLNNRDEALYLFNEKCQLEDEVLAEPDWPAGDNTSKQTLERRSDLSWQTSTNSGGTPKEENSSGSYEYYGGEGRSSSSSMPLQDTTPPIANAGPDQNAIINETIQFDGSQSTDNLKIVSYKWDINASDGLNWNNPDLTGEKPSFTRGYSQSDIYTVTLRVSDKAGNSATDTLTITVIQPPKILISEIQIDTTASSSYDFVELYNPNNFDIDISGFQLKKKASTGSETSIRVFPTGSKILAQSYFLWANSNYALSGLISADATSTQTLAKNNSLALFDKNGNLLDVGAWGSSTNPFVEGSPFSQNPEKDQSLGRKWIEGIGYQDTDNNSADFEIQTLTPKAKNQKDITPPIIQIISNPPSVTNQTQATFFFHASEENCTFECELDNQSWQSCGSPIKYENLSDGQHEFSVKAIDLFLNESLPAEYTWAIDTKIDSPTISLFDLETNSQFYTNQREVGVLAFVTEQEEGIKWFLSENETKPAIDDSNWQTSKPTIFEFSTPAQDGLKTVYIWTKDETQNISQLRNYASIILDITPPTSRITELDPWQASSVFTLSWSGSDFATGVEDGLTSGIADYIVQYTTDISDGIGNWLDLEKETEETESEFSGQDGMSYYFRVKAKDRAQNEGPWSEPASTTIDASPPLVNFDIIPSPQTQLSFALSWSATDPITATTSSGIDGFYLQYTTTPSDIDGVSLQYQDDEENWQDWKEGEKGTLILDSQKNNLTVLGKDERTYTFQIKAEDKAGNESNWQETSIQIKLPFAELPVVINEIAWMGTGNYAADEWIEFYNRNNTVIDIDGWSIFGADTGKCLNFSDADGKNTTIIPAKGYLLYANDDWSVLSNDNTALTDIWDASIEMNNTSPGQLILYSAKDCHGPAVDTANQPTGNWFSGSNLPRFSMERVSPRDPGDIADNWKNNDGLTINGKDKSRFTINATPKAQNSVYVSLPAAAITNLTVDLSLSSTNKIVLIWSAPADPDTLSENLSYDIRYLIDQEINDANWSNALPVSNEPAVLSSDTNQSITIWPLNYQKTYSFAIKTFGEGANSSLSNIVSFQSGIGAGPIWPMAQLNPQRTGKSPFVGPSLDSASVKWVLDKSSFSLAIGVDGIVYAGGSGDGLFSLDPETGNQKWVNSSLPFISSIAIGPDGTLYVLYQDGLAAVDQLGNKLWDFPLFPEDYDYTNGNLLAIYDNKIFFLADCSYPDGWRHLSLFNISTNGEANWVYSLETESFYNAPSFSCGSEEAHNLTGHYGSSVALDNSGNIYFGFEDTLYSFDQSGARRWKREFSDRIGVISTPAIWSNNIVYVSTPAIEAINPENGGSLWPQSSNATFDSLPFALNDNAIYSYFVNSIDGLSTVYGVDFSGAEKWQRRDLIFSEAAAPLVDVNNNLYVVGHASLHSYLYVFKNEGSEMKTFTVPSEPSLQGYYIAMAEDGTLYLSGRKLFAIK